ncbi:MAG: UDP-2,3-diacylglucosamine diphosphatase LpxI, partial [Planctomycetota bacterium]
ELINHGGEEGLALPVHPRQAPQHEAQRPQVGKVIQNTAFQRIGLLSFGGFLRFFGRHGVRDLTWAGWIRKETLFSVRGILNHLPDLRALRFMLWRLPRMDRQSQTLLAAMVDEFEREGFRVRDSTSVCRDLLVEEGVLTAKGPTRKQLADIAFGWRVAKRMADLDVGQSVAVRDRATIAVEGMEGTDRNIVRAGELCKRGFTVVKLAMDGHDMRFDVPTIGPQTVETLKTAGGAVLAVEAGKTIVLQRAETIALADRFGIVLVALSRPPET